MQHTYWTQQKGGVSAENESHRQYFVFRGGGALRGPSVRPTIMGQHEGGNALGSASSLVLLHGTVL
eukprot:1414891-Amphidinium_carterae.1